MACNSKLNTVKILKNKKLIDEDYIISDIEKFKEYNTLYTKIAKKNYDVDIGEDIFYITQREVKPIKGQTYNKDGQIIYKAVPNFKMFYLIDEKINKGVIEVVIEKEGDSLAPAYDDFSSDNSNKKVETQYQGAISYRENLINRAENRLDEIKQNKKDNASNADVLKELTKLEEEFITRLDGSDKLGIKGLKRSLKELINKSPIELFVENAEEDFDRLEKLSKSQNSKDLHEARNIINFYNNVGTFEVGVENLLFKTEEMFDSNAKLKVDKEVFEGLTKLKDRTLTFSNEISQRERQTIIDKVNNHSKVIKLYGKDKFKYKELFFEQEGLADMHIIDKYTMGITSGIFTPGETIPQMMQILLQEAHEDKLVYATSVSDRIEENKSDLESKLRELGYGINIPGLSAVSYEIFKTTDRNGLSRDGITQRYSPKFIDLRNRMINKFQKEMAASLLLEASQRKTDEINQIYSDKLDWHRKNTIIIDIRKIPEVINSEEFSDSKKFFKPENSEKYVKKLKELLGEQGYKEEIEKQLTLLRNYKVKSSLTKDSFTDDEKKNYRILNWEQKHNPFVMVENYYNNTRIRAGDYYVNSTLEYNYSVPRKHKVKVKVLPVGYKSLETSEFTGFYDENFKIIEGSPPLKKFHTLITEVMETIYNTMTVEERNKFSTNTLPALDKNMAEVIFDKGNSWNGNLSEAGVKIFDSITGMMGENLQNNLSKATVDPVTGKPDYKVNSDFLVSNRNEINSRYIVELQRIKEALGVNLGIKVKKNDRFNIKGNQKVITLLAENLGVNSTESAVKARLQSEDFSNIEIGKVLRNIITHQIVSEKSSDLPKILKLFSFLSMEYAARQEVLPIMEIFKNHYNDIQGIKTTKTGEGIKNVNESTGEVKSRLETYRENSIASIESWFERAVLGNYESKSLFLSSKIRDSFQFELSDEEKKQILEDDFKTVMKGKVFNRKEKILKSKIPNILKKLREDLKTANKKEEEVIKKAISDLILMEVNLGKKVTATSAMDSVFTYLRLKYLGWSLKSNLINFIEGMFANQTAAASGDFFTPENIYRAKHIMAGSFINNITFNKYSTQSAKLVRVLMDRWRILQDASNALQKNSSHNAFSRFRKWEPFEGTRRTEYLIQGEIMISILMDIKIKGIDKNGKEIESNVYDAMNLETADGTLKEEFRTKENIKNWEVSDGQQYKDFKTKTSATIVTIHGDYDTNRGNMMSETIAGKALQFFKRFLPMNYFQRFAVEQDNVELEIKGYKGRYRSFTRSTGLLKGAIIGFTGLGLLGMGGTGLILTAALGYALGGKKKNYGAANSAGFFKELAFNSKEVIFSMGRFLINNIAGKPLIKHADYSKLTDAGLSERDMINMKAVIMQMSIELSMLMIALIAKMLWYDDDDEKDSTRRQVHNAVINQIDGILKQSTMYLNPIETWKNLSTPVIYRYIMDVGKLGMSVGDLFSGDDIILTGTHTGDSKIVRQFGKTFNFTAFENIPSAIYDAPGAVFGDGEFTFPSLGFQSSTERQFNKSGIDRFFVGDEKSAQTKIRKKKLKVKARFINADMTEKEKETETKKIDKHFKKRKNEDYVEALERIKDKEYK